MLIIHSRRTRSKTRVLTSFSLQELHSRTPPNIYYTLIQTSYHSKLGVINLFQEMENNCSQMNNQKLTRLLKQVSIDLKIKAPHFLFKIGHLLCKNGTLCFIQRVHR